MTPQFRLGLLLWVFGMVGVVVVAVLVVPGLAANATAEKALPLSPSALSQLAIGQGAIFLALAVWAGGVLAPRLGLRAPLLEAAVENQSAGPWRRTMLAGVIGGLLGAGLLVGLTAIAPAELLAAAKRFTMPLAARLLYGGITEEILLRWGFMTALAAGLVRAFFKASGGASPTLIWWAIMGSALLFALGHLPAAAVLAGKITPQIFWFVVLGNGAFGVVAGWLFWRFGLEAAIVAHVLAHLLAFAVLG